MRRNRFGTAPEPASLGDHHLKEAVATIDRLCQRTVATMTEYSMSRDTTIRALFPQEVLDRAMAARDLIAPDSYIMSYDHIDHDVEVSMDYRTGIKSAYPPINESALVLQKDAEVLQQFIHDVRFIHMQFEEIKALLRWLNRKATPGAVRYYFPAASALCPHSPALLALPHVPTRFTQPNDINDWMDIIRNASATYASTQMLPGTAVARKRSAMWLTFGGAEVERGNVKFIPDRVTYNI
jgi:hypothetical protein